MTEAFLPLLSAHSHGRIVMVSSGAAPSFVAKCSAERKQMLTDPKVDPSDPIPVYPQPHTHTHPTPPHPAPTPPLPRLYPTQRSKTAEDCPSHPILFYHSPIPSQPHLPPHPTPPCAYPAATPPTGELDADLIGR